MLFKHGALRKGEGMQVKMTEVPGTEPKGQVLRVWGREKTGRERGRACPTQMRTESCLFCGFALGQLSLQPTTEERIL